MSPVQEDWQAVALVFGQSVVTATFAASLLSKLRDQEGFAAAIRGFALVKAEWIRPLAVALTGAEAVVLVLLVLGYAPVTGWAAVAGLGAGGALLVGYTAALAVVRARGMRVACHCFGASPARVSWYDVARNLLLLACTAVGLAGSASADRLTGADTALVVIGALAAALLITNLANVVATAVRVPGATE